MPLANYTGGSRHTASRKQGEAKINQHFAKVKQQESRQRYLSDPSAKKAVVILHPSKLERHNNNTKPFSMRAPYQDSDPLVEHDGTGDDGAQPRRKRSRAEMEASDKRQVTHDDVEVVEGKIKRHKRWPEGDGSLSKGDASQADIVDIASLLLPQNSAGIPARKLSSLKSAPKRRKSRRNKAGTSNQGQPESPPSTDLETRPSSNPLPPATASNPNPSPSHIYFDDPPQSSPPASSESEEAMQGQAPSQPPATPTLTARQLGSWPMETMGTRQVARKTYGSKGRKRVAAAAARDAASKHTALEAESSDQEDDDGQGHESDRAMVGSDEVDDSGLAHPVTSNPPSSKSSEEFLNEMDMGGGRARKSFGAIDQEANEESDSDATQPDEGSLEDGPAQTPSSPLNALGLGGSLGMLRYSGQGRPYSMKFPGPSVMLQSQDSFASEKYTGVEDAQNAVGGYGFGHNEIDPSLVAISGAQGPPMTQRRRHWRSERGQNDERNPDSGEMDQDMEYPEEEEATYMEAEERDRRAAFRLHQRLNGNFPRGGLGSCEPGTTDSFAMQYQDNYHEIRRRRFLEHHRPAMLEPRCADMGRGFGGSDADYDRYRRGSESDGSVLSPPNSSAGSSPWNRYSQYENDNSDYNDHDDGHRYRYNDESMDPESRFDASMQQGYLGPPYASELSDYSWQMQRGYVAQMHGDSWSSAKRQGCESESDRKTEEDDEIEPEEQAIETEESQPSKPGWCMITDTTAKRTISNGLIVTTDDSADFEDIHPRYYYPPKRDSEPVTERVILQKGWPFKVTVMSSKMVSKSESPVKTVEAKLQGEEVAKNSTWWDWIAWVNGGKGGWGDTIPPEAKSSRDSIIKQVQEAQKTEVGPLFPNLSP